MDIMMMIGQCHLEDFWTKMMSLLTSTHTISQWFLLKEIVIVLGIFFVRGNDNHGNHIYDAVVDDVEFAAKTKYV